MRDLENIYSVSALKIKQPSGYEKWMRSMRGQDTGKSSNYDKMVRGNSKEHIRSYSTDSKVLKSRHCKITPKRKNSSIGLVKCDPKPLRSISKIIPKDKYQVCVKSSVNKTNNQDTTNNGNQGNKPDSCFEKSLSMENSKKFVESANEKSDFSNKTKPNIQMSYNMSVTNHYRSKSKNVRIKPLNKGEYLSKAITLDSITNIIQHTLEDMNLKSPITDFTEKNRKGFFMEVMNLDVNGNETSSGDTENEWSKEEQKESQSNQRKENPKENQNKKKMVYDISKDITENEESCLNLLKSHLHSQTDVKTNKKRKSMKKKVLRYKKDQPLNKKNSTSSEEELLVHSFKNNKNKSNIQPISKLEPKKNVTHPVENFFPLKSKVGLSQLCSNADCSDLKETSSEQQMEILRNLSTSFKKGYSDEHIVGEINEAKAEFINTINKLGEVISSKSVQFRNQNAKIIGNILQDISEKFTNSSSAKSVKIKDRKHESSLVACTALSKTEKARDSYPSTSNYQANNVKSKKDSNEEDDIAVKPAEIIYEKFNQTKSTQLDHQRYNKQFKNKEYVDSGIQCTKDNTVSSHSPPLLEKGTFCNMPTVPKLVQNLADKAIQFDNKSDQDYVYILSKKKFMNIIKEIEEKHIMFNEDDKLPLKYAVGVQAVSKKDENVSTERDKANVHAISTKESISNLHKVLEQRKLASKLTYQQSLLQSNTGFSFTSEKMVYPAILFNKSEIMKPKMQLQDERAYTLDWDNTYNLFNTEELIENRDVNVEEYYKQNFTPTFTKNMQYYRNILNNSEPSVKPVSTDSSKMYKKYNKKPDNPAKEQDMWKLQGTKKPSRIQYLKGKYLKKILQHKVGKNSNLKFSDLRENEIARSVNEEQIKLEQVHHPNHVDPEIIRQVGAQKFQEAHPSSKSSRGSTSNSTLQNIEYIGGNSEQQSDEETEEETEERTEEETEDITINSEDDNMRLSEPIEKPVLELTERNQLESSGSELSKKPGRVRVSVPDQELPRDSQAMESKPVITYGDSDPVICCKLSSCIKKNRPSIGASTSSLSTVFFSKKTLYTSDEFAPESSNMYIESQKRTISRNDSIVEDKPDKDNQLSNPKVPVVVLFNNKHNIFNRNKDS